MNQSVTSLDTDIVELFAASDYRTFLSAIISRERSEGRPGSLKSVSQRLGIGLSTLKMVLSGSRDLTIKNIHTVARGLRLTRLEHEYFENLVLRDQAEDDEVEAHYENKLLGIGREIRARRIRVSDAAVLGDWCVPSILVYIMDIDVPPAEGMDDDYLCRAAERLGISKSKIAQTMAALKAANLVFFKPDGRIHVAFERIQGKLIKQRFLRDMFAECQRRLESDFENEDALFIAHTLSIPRRTIKSFYDDCKELVERYMVLEEKHADVEVLQVCAQAFPISGRSGGSERRGQ